MGAVFLVFLAIVFGYGAWRQRTGTLVLTTRKQEREQAEAYLRANREDAP